MQTTVDNTNCSEDVIRLQFHTFSRLPMNFMVFSVAAYAEELKVPQGPTKLSRIRNTIRDASDGNDNPVSS